MLHAYTTRDVGHTGNNQAKVLLVMRK